MGGVVIISGSINPDNAFTGYNTEMRQVRRGVYDSVGSLLQKVQDRPGCDVKMFVEPNRYRLAPHGKYLVLVDTKGTGMHLVDEMKGIIDKGNRRLEELCRNVEELLGEKIIRFKQIDYDVRSHICAGDVQITISDASKRKCVKGWEIIYDVEAEQEERREKLEKEKETLQAAALKAKMHNEMLAAQQLEGYIANIDAEIDDIPDVRNAIDPDQYYTVRYRSGYGYQIHWYDPTDSHKHTASVGDVTICVGGTKLVMAKPRKRRSDAVDPVWQNAWWGAYPTKPPRSTDDAGECPAEEP